MSLYSFIFNKFPSFDDIKLGKGALGFVYGRCFWLLPNMVKMNILGYAVVNNDIRKCKFIVNNGGIDIDGIWCANNILMYAINNDEIFEFLLKKGSTTVPTRSGTELLISAANKDKFNAFFKNS